jgi:hypothetical protein
VASFAIRSRSAGHPGRSVKTHHALRLKPDHSIGAGHWLWRYDYNHVRPHSSLGNKTPAEARRALELFDGNAPGALATPETDAYQTQGLSL